MLQIWKLIDWLIDLVVRLVLLKLIGKLSRDIKQCHLCPFPKRQKHFSWLFVIAHLQVSRSQWLNFHHPLLSILDLSHCLLFNQQWWKLVIRAQRLTSKNMSGVYWDYTKIRYVPTALEVVPSCCDADMRLLSTRQHQALHRRDNAATPWAPASHSQGRWELGSHLPPAFKGNRTPRSGNCSLIFALRQRFYYYFYCAIFQCDGYLIL